MLDVLTVSLEFGTLEAIGLLAGEAGVAFLIIFVMLTCESLKSALSLY